MPEIPRLALPLLAVEQSQKDVTHNDALLALDRLVARAVGLRGLTAPPVSPGVGSVWMVPADGLAAWGHATGSLIHWSDSKWLVQDPRDGQLAFVADEAVLLVHAGGWQPVGCVAAPAPVAVPSGGEAIDNDARAALAAVVAALQQQGLLV